jgi:hypothetical protein
MCTYPQLESDSYGSSQFHAVMFGDLVGSGDQSHCLGFVVVLVPQNYACANLLFVWDSLDNCEVDRPFHGQG